jgi:nitrogen regulatory protein P-II 2
MPMPTQPLQLVTIVCEVLIEDRLVRDLKRLGVTGYTRSSVRGEGRRSIRDEWEGNNARLEMLVRPEVAERILDRLEQVYMPSYPIVAWVHEVRALIAATHIEMP